MQPPQRTRGAQLKRPRAANRQHARGVTGPNNTERLFTPEGLLYTYHWHCCYTLTKSRCPDENRQTNYHYFARGEKQEVVQQTASHRPQLQIKMPKSNWKRPQDAVYEGVKPSILDITQATVSPPPLLPPPQSFFRHRQLTRPPTLETQNQTGAIAQRSILRGSSMYSLILIRNCTASLPSSRRWS